jgi:cyanate permease
MGKNSQLAFAILLTFCGLALLFMGFFYAPTGEIHNSVLIGFGETATFAGALFGVDYRYRHRRKQQQQQQQRRRKTPSSSSSSPFPTFQGRNIWR